MKKYLFGLSAAILAIGFSSFTIAKKFTRQTIYVFEYQKSTFTEAEVENLINWKITDHLDCTFINNKPCKIEVLDIYTEIVNGERKLRTTAPKITIVASPGSAGVYHPDTGSCIDIYDIHNRL